MAQISPQVTLNGSRLVRFLIDLDISDVKPSNQGMAERIGELMDLSSSFALSSLHSKLPTLAFEPLSIPAERIQQEFLRVRQSLVQSITKGFATDSKNTTRSRFPAVRADLPADKLTRYELYEQCYAAHQREMEQKFHYLQSYVRDAAAGLSPRLTQLVALDEAVGETLLPFGRRLFAGIPGLLERRFQHLQMAHQGDRSAATDTGPPTWLTTFGREMQGLLLAELEVRLLPIQGLVEALQEETKDEASTNPEAINPETTNKEQKKPQA